MSVGDVHDALLGQRVGESDAGRELPLGLGGSSFGGSRPAEVLEHVPRRVEIIEPHPRIDDEIVEFHLVLNVRAAFDGSAGVLYVVGRADLRNRGLEIRAGVVFDLEVVEKQLVLLELDARLDLMAARDLAGEVDAAEQCRRFALEILHSRSAAIEREIPSETTYGVVGRVAGVERILVDVRVDSIREIRSFDVDETVIGDEVAVRGRHRPGIAVRRWNAVRIDPKQVVVVLAPVTLDERSDREPITPEEACRQLELPGGLSAPVHRYVRTVAQRGYEHAATVDVYEYAVLLAGAGRLHGAAAEKIPLTVGVASRGEERQPVAETRKGAAQRALYVVRTRRGHGAQVREAIRVGRNVVPHERAKAACVLTAAVFRYDVHDAGLRLPVLRIERPTDDLDFLDRVVFHLVGERLIEHVVDRHPVDHVGHLALTSTAKMPVDDSGLQINDVGEIQNGKGFELFRRNGGRARGEVSLYERPISRHDDFFTHDGLLAEAEVHLARLVDPNTHVLDGHRREADEGGPNCVDVRPEPQNRVVPIEIGGAALRRADDDHVHPGERLAGRGVDDAAGDFAGLRLRRLRDAPTEYHQNEQDGLQNEQDGFGEIHDLVLRSSNRDGGDATRRVGRRESGG